jgi:polysaccharide biosynthesis transport protein
MRFDRGAERANATDEPMMANGQLASDLGQPLEDGLSARALLSSIRRHLLMVLTFTLSLCAAGALVGLGLPAWFKAEGVLVIPAVPQRMAELQELPDASPDSMVIQSEVDILESRSVIKPVVRSLRLWEAPEFQKMEYPKGWSWQIVEMRLGEIWHDIWGPPGGPEDSSREQPIATTQPSDAKPPTQAQIDAAVGTYAGYLEVTNDGHSMTIHVSYRAWTPERAAAIVNAHMESYRNFEVETKVAAAKRANAALTSQVTELRQQLQAAEAAVTRYREEHNLTGAAEDRAAVSQQLVGLNSQLITARADLAESQVRAAGIGAGAGSNVPEVVASGTISGLRSQEAQLAAHEADLAKYHGDQYPELQRVRASLQTLQSQISRQTGRERAAALQMVERSRARERFLQQSITQLTNQLNSADAGLQQLEGKAESIRSLLLNLEKREAETAANPAFITPNSIIASGANPSAASTSPKAKTLALVGGFVGFTIGSLLSVLLELREKGFRTSAQVQQHIGSLTVSATPRALGRQRKAPADIILNDNRCAFAEAFRVSWANIQLALEGENSAAPGRNRPGTALGITSAAGGEGKSVHALGLARTAALAGESVVIVDADLRRSGVSGLLDQHFQFTLWDFLQDRCTAKDLIAVEQRSGVHFVPSAPAADIAWTNQELHRFFNFIDDLKRRFAIVIIDLPPTLGLAETIRLATAADSIALVIRWGRTERQLVQSALDALRSAGVSTIAVILNDIDLKAQRRRGYRDHTLVYTDKGLYRTEPGYREPAPEVSMSMAAAQPEPASETDGSVMQRGDDPPPDRSRVTGSMIEKWYDRYRD